MKITVKTQISDNGTALSNSSKALQPTNNKST